MNLHEFLVENFAGDLEYHPRRAVLYLALGAAALNYWVFSAPDMKFTTIPLVFALGSLTLIVKGVFLFRKSSEGLALTEPEIADLSRPSSRKSLPSIANQAAQIVQDFGAGPLLLWALLHAGKDIDQSWNNPPVAPVFISGAILFFSLDGLPAASQAFRISG